MTTQSGSSDGVTGARLRDRGDIPSEGILKGHRVIEMSLAAVGPMAGLLLAHLGAEVIRIEPPGGDPRARNNPPTQAGLSTLFVTCNLGKKHLVLDLKRADHQQAIHNLIAGADILIENLRPGVTDRLGMGYEQLREINESLIYCDMSGYGDRPWLAHKAANDPLIQAASGFMSQNGADIRRPEMLRYFTHLDFSTASYAVSGILLALIQRLETGTGQKIEVPMMRCSLSVQLTRVAEYLSGAFPPGGAQATTDAPDDAFRCRDGRFIAISVQTDEEWSRCCDAFGNPELLQRPEFSTSAGRLASRNEMSRLLGVLVSGAPSAWWRLQFRRYRVPAAIFGTVDEIRYSPQVVANGFLQSVDTKAGPFLVTETPWRFDRADSPSVRYRSGTNIRKSCWLPWESPARRTLSQCRVRPMAEDSSRRATGPTWSQGGGLHAGPLRPVCESPAHRLRRNGHEGRAARRRQWPEPGRPRARIPELGRVRSPQRRQGIGSG